jgi:hypothetical protein
MSGKLRTTAQRISPRVARGLLRRSAPASNRHIESVKKNRGSAVSRILKRTEGREAIAVHSDDLSVENSLDRQRLESVRRAGNMRQARGAEVLRGRANVSPPDMLLRD